MSARLTFFGGAGAVTGVNILFEAGAARILLDCGLLQRESQADAKNREPFAYEPSSVPALIVSHAHADHVGRVPKLVRDGFSGVIHSTEATRDLSRIMFEDSLRIMRGEHEAWYDEKDVARSLSLWKVHEYHEPFDIEGTRCEFLDAGHILGSGMVKLSGGPGGKTLLFTGDLGNSPEPLLPDTESPQGANYIIMESVYGDRLHEEQRERKEHLRSAVEETRRKGGTLLIPAFSIERTQILLHELNDMVESKEIEPIPVFLDSPLATRVTEVFRRHTKLLNEEMRGHFERGDDPFSFSGMKLTVASRESQDIRVAPDPKIIIAGSGMSIGGRIRGHERFFLPDANATLLFVGYQAPGSLGRRLLDGARTVTIDREEVVVRARVASLSGYSGHKDRDALLSFVESAGETLERVFVSMGEPKAASFLAQRIHDFLGVDAIVAEERRVYEIDW